MNIRYLNPNPSGSPAILFIHGLGADAESWYYQLEYFAAAGMKPIAMDVPGFGESPFSGDRWDIPASARILHGFMKELHRGPFILAGISMGGAIALQMALDYAQDVQVLALINTFACLRPRRLSELLYLSRRFIIAQVSGVQKQAEMVANRIFPQEKDGFYRQNLIEKITQADQSVYKQAMRSLATFDVRRRLKEIRCPTQVITGENDTTVAREIQNELHAGISGSKQVIIPGGGHAVIVDRPDLFNQCFHEFLGDTVRNSGDGHGYPYMSV